MSCKQQMMGYEKVYEQDIVELHAPTQQWSTHLCECCSDGNTGSCFMSTCLPAVQYGLNRAALDGKDCCGPYCVYNLLVCIPTLAHAGVVSAVILPIYTSQMRATLREKYNIGTSETCTGLTCCGKEIEDCCTHAWCMPCALVQEHREMKLRGNWEMNPVVFSAPLEQNMAPELIADVILVTEV